MAFWQSPRKRQQWYIMDLLTTDFFNKEIKLFNLADLFTGRYQTLSQQMYQEDRQLQFKHTRISLLWSVLPVLANAGIYLYVALFDFLAYKPQIVAPERPVALEVPVGSRGLDIEFRNVSFTYPGKSEPALKNISFTLRAGESIALVGQNGAGKTTLVKLLTRLYDPTEGEILVGGRNIKEYDPRELRGQIGVIFQDYVQYHLPARENIGIGLVAEIENLPLVEMAARAEPRQLSHVWTKAMMPCLAAGSSSLCHSGRKSIGLTVFSGCMLSSEARDWQ